MATLTQIQRCVLADVAQPHPAPTDGWDWRWGFPNTVGNLVALGLVVVGDADNLRLTEDGVDAAADLGFLRLAQLLDR